jgi:hypothetical protein
MFGCWRYLQLKTLNLSFKRYFKTRMFFSHFTYPLKRRQKNTLKLYVKFFKCTFFWIGCKIMVYIPLDLECLSTFDVRPSKCENFEFNLSYVSLVNCFYGGGRGLTMQARFSSPSSTAAPPCSARPSYMGLNSAPGKE